MKKLIALSLLAAFTFTAVAPEALAAALTKAQRQTIKKLKLRNCNITADGKAHCLKKNGDVVTVNPDGSTSRG